MQQVPATIWRELLPFNILKQKVPTEEVPTLSDKSGVAATSGRGSMDGVVGGIPYVVLQSTVAVSKGLGGGVRFLTLPSDFNQ